MAAKISANNMVTGAVIRPDKNLAMLFIEYPYRCDAIAL
jgi:hypothetical protein